MKMGTVFMNSENSKTSKQHVLILKITNKLDLRIGEKTLPSQILAFITNGKRQKAHAITINLKYLHQYGMINLNCPMDRILYQIFKTILNIFKKKQEKILINHKYRYV